jgi:tetratricopeptide (TPR) repeat protein
LAIRLEVLKLLPESSDRYPWALANLALTHLEMGRPDLALSMLETVTRRIGPDPQLLTYLAAAHEALGHNAQAEALLDQAAHLAPPDDMPRYAIHRARPLVRAERHEEAAAVLLEHGLPDKDVYPRNGWVLLDEAATWTTLLERHVDLPARAQRRVKELPVMMGRLARQAKANGDASLHVATLERRARLADATQVGSAAGMPVRQLWEKAYAVREQYGMPANALTLLKLAFDGYLRGDVRAGRRYLRQLPAAITTDIGAMPDLSLVIHEPAKLTLPLAHLAHLLGRHHDAKRSSRQRRGRQPGWQDFRLVAELQRDAAGRVGALRRAPSLSLFEEGLTDRVLKRLAPERGGLVVIEWLHGQPWWDGGPVGLRCLLTRIDSSGRVATTFLPQVEVDLPAVASRLRTRLFGWIPRRRGDPLDELNWRSLAEWIVDMLREHAAPDDHVVIFEHQATAGLPWHTAIGPLWPVSYAPGWTALFDFLSKPPPSRDSIGVLAVPRVGEQPEVVTALRASAANAARLGVRAIAPPETACDRAAFERVMRECDLAVLLCHGYISEADQEVALMLAHEGMLPLAGSVAAGSAAGVAHRLSWRDCTTLPRASRTVFSAACSTGVSYHAGLGDRLGLFSAMRHAGATALVAPGWDAVAGSVLPIFDDVVARFVAGEPLGRALREACRAGQARQPRWLAWALTLEGDWR